MKIAFLARALVLVCPCLANAQIAILQIKITDGEGAVYAAGSRSPRPLSVLITDETGRPVATAAVSFRLPDEGPGGLFSNGLRSELVISDSNGRATVRNLQLNRTPGAFQVRITAAKEQARAGTLSRQFISGATAAAGREPVVKAKSGKKWLVLALLAAGVAGGLGAGVAGRSPAPHPAPTAPGVAIEGVTIGAPTISVGRP